MRILGAMGLHCSTVCSAQASAADALSTQLGGTPLPHATRPPVLSMTTTPNPKEASWRHLGFMADPSMTHVISGLVTSGGLESHWNVCVVSPL